MSNYIIIATIACLCCFFAGFLLGWIGYYLALRKEENDKILQDEFTKHFKTKSDATSRI